MKNKNIARAIRLVYDSLESHLDDTFDPLTPKLKDKRAKDHICGQRFHIKCVQEYAEIIKILSDLL